MDNLVISKPKFWNLSIYRLIATLCVLAFHLVYLTQLKVDNWVYFLSKGVQGLTMLSAFLYSQKAIKDIKNFYLKNLIKIIIPALIVALGVVIFDTIFFFSMGGGNWKDYINCFTDTLPKDGRFITQLDNFYYLGYLFICYLLLPVLHKSYNDKSIWAYVVIGVVAIAELVLAYFFGMAIILNCFIFGFYFGKYFFKKLTSNEEKPGFSSWFIAIFLTAISIGIYATSVRFLPSINIVKLLENIMMSTFGIGSALLIILLFKWANNISRLSFFKFTDKICLYIYLLNQLFMVGITNLTDYINNLPLAFLVIIACTIITSIALYYLEVLIKLPFHKKDKELAK